jgi:hypothetical protein
MSSVRDKLRVRKWMAGGNCRRARLRAELAVLAKLWCQTLRETSANLRSDAMWPFSPWGEGGPKGRMRGMKLPLTSTAE